LVTVYGKAPAEGSNFQTDLWWILKAHQYRKAAIACGVGSFLGFLLLTIYLCTVSGKRSRDEKPRCNLWDRIPTELYLIGVVGFLFVQLILLDNTSSLHWFTYLLGSIFLAMDSFLMVVSIVSLSTRIKTGAILSGTLTVRLVCFLKKELCRLWENLLLVPKVILVLGLVAAFDLFLATFLSYTEFISAMLVEGITLAGILIWYAASIHRLHRDLSRISQGNLEHRCDPSRLPPGLRGFGSELNSSAEGMERAVEEKMKSERFKTELITNVSHDIKTPITSIVNYVDLMKKETVENETVKGYLEVLDRQSLRLKKLAEDLVESSKAASGVLPVTLAPCDLRVLLEQALAEYQENFSGKNLEICFSAPENAGFIMADGKHLWRIVDNLLGNVVKYALSGTRVYVNLEYGEEVQVVFRNISEKALALSGEELSERFVRGDASRNTEGSGLGLAIARSLTELQNGKMKISVDGDLFKVTLSFRPIQ